MSEPTNKNSIETSTTYEGTVKYVIKRTNGEISGIQIIHFELKPLEMVISGSLEDEAAKVARQTMSLGDFKTMIVSVPEESDRESHEAIRDSFDTLYSKMTPDERKDFLERILKKATGNIPGIDGRTTGPIKRPNRDA